MARAKSPAITQRQVIWLAAAALLVLLPLTPFLPLWLSTLCGLSILWRAWLLWRRFPLPPLWLVNLAAMAGALAISLHFRTFLGKDSGVALLTLFLALKLFETRSVRDAFTVVLLGLFLTLSQFFYSQSMATAFMMGLAVLLLIATLNALQRSAIGPGEAFRGATLLIGQALPFMLILFLFFPRVAGPLWGLPSDSGGGTSGLSESMSPGTISQLSLSEAIAFRVRFVGPMPAQRQLYWRGPVLSSFDGLTWHTDRLMALPKPPYIASGPGYRYEMTLEPHNQRWLLALDYPADLPPDSQITPAFQVLANKPVHNRLRFTLDAFPDTLTGDTERSDILRAALRLPTQGNPRSRAFAGELRSANPSDPKLIEAFLSHIRRASFVYTLTPPKLGHDTVDEFLFDTRRGFCEHYASAFVFVLRAAGVPSRVVTGYQGGEINPVDGFLEVRQSDAHAWAEVWLPGEGWRRVDPTAAVAPSRVESNLAAAVPRGDPLPLFARPEMNWLRQWRYRWEALNNAWNQWVLSYDHQRQMTILRQLGWTSPDWQTLAGLLAASCAALTAAMSLWVLKQRQRRDPLQALWQSFEQKLAPRGLKRHAWEGPVAYASRLEAALPEQAEEIAAICRLYQQMRYGTVPPSTHPLRQLKHAIAAFRLRT